MDYRAVWEDDPGGDPQAAYESLKGLTTAVVSPLSSSKLNRWAAQFGVRSAIMQASENYSHPAYDAAAAARFALENIAEPLDVTYSGNQSLIAALVSAGLVPQAAADALTAMATEQAPKHPNLDPEDVVEARRIYGAK